MYSQKPTLRARQSLPTIFASALSSRRLALISLSLRRLLRLRSVGDVLAVATANPSPQPSFDSPPSPAAKKVWPTDPLTPRPGIDSVRARFVVGLFLPRPRSSSCAART